MVQIHWPEEGTTLVIFVGLCSLQWADLQVHYFYTNSKSEEAGKNV